MNPVEKAFEALALVPLTYPRRSELESEIVDFELSAPEPAPTLEEIKECFLYYLGTNANVAWKKKIAEILTEQK